jgi:uncharacterized protein (TIGR02246 family)
LELKTPTLEAAMYLSRFLVPLVVSISSLSAVYAQDAKKTADDFASKWVTTYNAGDAAALASLFTPDAVFNVPSGEVLKGRDAIEKAFAARIKGGWTKETLTTTDVGLAGDGTLQCSLRTNPTKYAMLSRSDRATPVTGLTPARCAAV